MRIIIHLRDFAIAPLLPSLTDPQPPFTENRETFRRAGIMVIVRYPDSN
jgi:hypothetical protein